MDDNKWGRMCAEHALPLGWERMDYDEFCVSAGIEWQNLSVWRSGSLAVNQMRRLLRPPGFSPEQKRFGNV